MKVIGPWLESRLIETVSQGIPLVSRPYQAIAEQLGCSEQDVIWGLNKLLNSGDIKRFGVVVRHRKLGYKANGMVVWDIPDEKIDEIGRGFSQYSFITLCYQRPRYLPEWPYNLFSMVHGKNRPQVLDNIKMMVDQTNLDNIDHEILFSKRCFKQRGALFKQGSCKTGKAGADPDNRTISHAH